MENEKQSYEPKKSKMSSCIKITWKVLEKVLLIVIVFVSLIILTQRISNNEKAFLGFRIFRVQTGSMIPKYQIGDVIVVKEREIDKIVIGDDVTYWGTTGSMRGKLVTHQVVNIEEIDGKKVFHTKGIANNTEDPVIYGEQINGVVLSKAYLLTAITHGLANQYIFYFCGIIPLTFFIFLTFIRSNNRKFEQYK